MSRTYSISPNKVQNSSHSANDANDSKSETGAAAGTPVVSKGFTERPIIPPPSTDTDSEYRHEHKEDELTEIKSQTERFRMEQQKTHQDWIQLQQRMAQSLLEQMQQIHEECMQQLQEFHLQMMAQIKTMGMGRANGNSSTIPPPVAEPKTTGLCPAMGSLSTDELVALRNLAESSGVIATPRTTETTATQESVPASIPATVQPPVPVAIQDSFQDLPNPTQREALKMPDFSLPVCAEDDDQDQFLLRRKTFSTHVDSMEFDESPGNHQHFRDIQPLGPGEKVSETPKTIPHQTNNRVIRSRNAGVEILNKSDFSTPYIDTGNFTPLPDSTRSNHVTSQRTAFTDMQNSPLRTTLRKRQKPPSKKFSYYSCLMEIKNGLTTSKRNDPPNLALNRSRPPDRGRFSIRAGRMSVKDRQKGPQ